MEEFSNGKALYLETSIDRLHRCPRDPQYYGDALVDCQGGKEAPFCPGEESGQASCVRFTAMATSYLEAQKKTFFAVALALGLLYLIAMLICALGVKERCPSRRAFQVPLLSSLYRYDPCTTGERHVVLVKVSEESCVSSSSLCMGSGWTVAFHSHDRLPFFRPLCDCERWIDCTQDWTSYGSFGTPRPVFSDTRLSCFKVCVSACMVGFLLGAIIATRPWLQISHRLGRYKSWVFAHVLSLMTNFLFLIVREGNTWLAIGIMFLNGLPVSAQFLTSSVLADVIDYDEVRLRGFVRF